MSSPHKPLERPKLRTHVSEAYWCNPEANYSFEKAALELPGSPNHPETPVESTAWLDELLDGGIVLPRNTNTEPSVVGARTGALTILLAGGPGTGKSTLATELAYRWCTTNAWASILDGKRPRIVYVSNESKAPWIINNATSLRWDPPPQGIFQTSEQTGPIPHGKVRIVAYPTTKGLKKLAAELADDDFGDAIKSWIGRSDKPRAEVVIVDSLNTVSKKVDRLEIFSSVYKWAAAGPRVLVMILDSSRSDEAADVWEFASDVVIRLGRKYDDSGYTGYMIRSIEIVKARYQKHVWGRHQLKIHEGSSLKEEFRRGQPMSEQEASDRMRAHPYRKQGGIFIFPSIHYVLSLYKRKAPTGLDESIRSCVPNLDQLLGAGYPKGRCTAMIGLRGGHKSHLGYEEILWRILPEDKQGRRIPDFSHKAMVVSLRDDEGLTKETMQQILERSGVVNARERLAELQREGLLEITYYPPGYITPEEFFHRLLLSIKRLKRTDTARPKEETQVSLLFNSLEQLSSRFPLCAKEPIFVPGIIQMLTAEEVSSFFVTAIDRQSKESKETYGLETMAELILEFDRRTCSPREYAEHVKRAYKGRSLKSVRVELDRQVTTIRVERYAGGQAAGREGILELIEKEKKHPLKALEKKRDLVFMSSEGIKKSDDR